MHTMNRILFNKELLQDYRQKNNIMQKEFAQMMGTSPNVISYWETGRRTPMPPSVDKMVEVTGIPHEDFYEVNDITFGAKLTTIRLKLNLGQREVADAMHTSPENLNRWEADKHTPSLYFVYQLSKIYGVSMEELITDRNGKLLIEDPHATEIIEERPIDQKMTT